MTKIVDQMKPASQKQLNTKQQRAVLLLASGYSAKEVGLQLKVAEGTVHNWKSQNKRFQKQLNKVQREMFSSGVSQLNALVSIAAQTLANVMNDEEATHRDKISAARTILQHCDRALPHAPASIMKYEDIDEYLRRMKLQ